MKTELNAVTGWFETAKLAGTEQEWRRACKHIEHIMERTEYAGVRVMAEKAIATLERSR